MNQYINFIETVTDEFSIFLDKTQMPFFYTKVWQSSSSAFNILYFEYKY